MASPPPYNPELFKQVGFDYAGALLELRNLLSYEELAALIGYESKASIARVIGGAEPPHRQGEAIWALYNDLMGKKPPLNVSVRERKRNKV